ncbi:MAG: ACP phosphodiesterase [Cyclobacteriaceae bacterium]
MNFLGHFFLSPDHPEQIVGNFMADFVKGKKFLDYPQGIAEGIMIHRSIDHFTDTHPSFLQSKRKFFENYRHFSGVITDMVYDHLLARYWQMFHVEPLEVFAERMYATISPFKNILPEGSLMTFTYMRKNNWLVNYAHKEGLTRSLKGLSRRIPYDINLENAVVDLEIAYNQYFEEFKNFIVDARLKFK